MFSDMRYRIHTMTRSLQFTDRYDRLYEGTCMWHTYSCNGLKCLSDKNEQHLKQHCSRNWPFQTLKKL